MRHLVKGDKGAKCQYLSETLCNNAASLALQHLLWDVWFQYRKSLHVCDLLTEKGTSYLMTNQLLFVPFKRERERETFMAPHLFLLLMKEAL